MPRISNIDLFSLPQRQVLTIRKRGVRVEQLPALIGEAYQRMGAYCQKTSTLLAGMPFVCYYNMDMQDLDVAFGFPIAMPLPGEGDIACRTLPAQTVLSCMYLGAYTGMEPVYGEMMRWFTENGCEPASMVYEHYYNDPDRPESEYLTKIVMPVKQ